MARTYDPEDVTLNVAGTVIVGFAEDSFIKAERLEDNFTPYVGAKGEVSHAENANKTGEITITLESTSPSVNFLNGLAERKGQNALFPVSVVDMNERGVIISGDEARVRKPEGYEAGKEINEREFVIFVSQMDFR